jgi:capsular exopolysaccharide synthesis family protein
VTLWSFVQILRKRWLVVASFTLLGLLVAGLLSAITPRTYQAEARSFVTITSTGSDANSVYQNSQFAMARVKSYTLLVDNPKVLNGVIDELGLSESPEDLRSQITAQNPPDTAFVNIDAVDRNPRRAAAIANTVAGRLGSEIEKLETPRSGGTSPVKVTVTTPATRPTSPVSPRWPLNLAVGLLGGFAVGVAFAVTREQLDTTIKSGDDLQEVTGMSPLTLIRLDAKSARRPLPVMDSRSPMVESFRTLRTNLKFADVDHPPRQVVVTSALAHEGKSTTAQNLAIALAQSGMRVCLVEADLRRPKVTENLGLEGAVGLTNVVAGEHNLQEVLVPWNRGLVTVLPAGTTPSDPASLLGSHNAQMLLQDLRQSFDFVVIDAPPLLPVSDAAVLAGETDGALLVVRHGHTKQDQVQAAVETLRAVNARLVGSVLTFVPDKRRFGRRKDAYTYASSAKPTHVARGRAADVRDVATSASPPAEDGARSPVARPR